MTQDTLATGSSISRGVVQVSTLSDSRDVIYFDDPGSTHLSRASDRRKATERALTPQMRLDPMTGEWISISPQRNTRAHLPAEEQCPLCPQTENNLSELPGPFDVAVFENKSPSFGPEVGHVLHGQTAFGLEATATGRCEVVVFSPDHHGSFGNQSVERIGTVINAWTHRTEQLKSLPGVQVVFPFENRGEDIGVTLHHPHGQIYAYPFIPPRMAKILRAAENYRGDFFDDYVRYEAQSLRLVHRGDHFSVFVPFAPHWPIELVLIPHKPHADFTALSDSERAELAVVLRGLFQGLDNLDQEALPYISSWYQAPVGMTGEQMRFHLRVTSPRRGPDKLKFPAGSETAMEAFISDINPERQAEWIRSHISI